MFCKISIKIVIVQYYRGKNKDDGSDNLFKYKIGLQTWIFHTFDVRYILIMISLFQVVILY